MLLARERQRGNVVHKILIFTDIHVREAGRPIIGLDPFVRFQTGLDHALTHHADAAHLILMGDLTHEGTAAQYARLEPALRDLQMPLTLMPGNHDRREPLVAAFPEQTVTETGHMQRMIEIGKDCLITLDTLDGPPYREGHHSGLLCTKRMDWLRTALEAAEGRRVTIYMHHPPMRSGFDGMDDIMLRNADAFYALLAGFPNVAHIFAGHIHRTISGSQNGIGFTIFKSPCHQMPMLLGAPGSNQSNAEPGAYGIVLLTEAGVIAHTEDFEEAARHTPLGYDAVPHPG